MVSTPKMPAVRYPDPLPPSPERTGDQTQALAAEQRARFANRGGRANTMLTGGGGTDSGIGAVRFLGGAART